MITKVFKTFMGMAFISRSSNYVAINKAFKDVQGNDKYLIPYFNEMFPDAFSYTFQTGAASTGIWFGSGTAAATENDYCLASRITSGLTVTTTTSGGVDASGNPYTTNVFTVRNTSNAAITIAEIGSVQKLYAGTSAGATSGGNTSFLIDRTVLANPVTIAAGDTAVIDYTTKTVIPE